jgi:hypothetical protein
VRFAQRVLRGEAREITAASSSQLATGCSIAASAVSAATGASTSSMSATQARMPELRSPALSRLATDRHMRP